MCARTHVSHNLNILSSFCLNVTILPRAAAERRWLIIPLFSVMTSITAHLWLISDKIECVCHLPAWLNHTPSTSDWPDCLGLVDVSHSYRWHSRRNREMYAVIYLSMSVFCRVGWLFVKQMMSRQSFHWHFCCRLGFLTPLFKAVRHLQGITKCSEGHIFPRPLSNMLGFPSGIKKWNFLLLYLIWSKTEVWMGESYSDYMENSF